MEGTRGSPSRLERFRAIYEANYGPLLAYVLRRTRSAEDGADALAETFLVAWRRLDQVPDGSETRLWLFGVARRVLANSARAGTRRDRLHASLLIEAEILSVVRPTTDADLSVDVVSEALGQLHERDRELLRLVAWEGLSYDELAVVLGCTRGAARIRVHRARRRLAAHLVRLGIDVQRRPGPGHGRADGPRPVATAKEGR